MKKILAILLLGCFCLNLTGYHFVFIIRKASLKMAMKEMMRRQVSSADVIEFNFSLSRQNGQDAPVWENEYEFRLKGKMYDVIEKKTVDNKLVVRCISDEKETELIKKYEELLDRQSGTSSKKEAASIMKLLTSPFTIPVSILQAAIKSSLHESFPNYCCGTLAASREVITPPPRLL